MDSTTDSAATPATNVNLGSWGQEMSDAGVDWVPDPMMLRAAELFVAGRTRCEAQLQCGADTIWPVIDRNLDSVIAFFHALMTRERVPFIDYNMTYRSLLLQERLGPLGLEVHPMGAYDTVRAIAVKQLAGFRFDQVDPTRAALVREETMVFEYFWEPRLDGIEVAPEHVPLARFALGGLVFGAYAQAARSDHLLQSTRANLFVDLAADGALPLSRGLRKEGELFEGIRKLANGDPRFAVERETAPPTVLHHLLAKGVATTDALLDQALELRTQEPWKKYRVWYGQLRESWNKGMQDPNAANEVATAVQVISQRIKGKPLLLAKLRGNFELSGEGKVGVDAVLGSAQARVRGRVEIQTPWAEVKLPSKLRNWFVDHFLLESHQKLLVDISLNQLGFDDLAYGLHGLWMAS